MIKLFRFFVKEFDKHNVCVCGMKGAGKDLLFGNVIARRRKTYVSNLDYTSRKNYIPLRFADIDCGGATWKDFVNGSIPRYRCPYPLGTDVFLSDAGVYLPSQYCNEINKLFPHIATYQALSRQLSKSGFHINTQNLNRCYDKIREQSDVYFWCDRCIYIPIVNLVIQKIIRYDKYESACNRVKPCRIRVPLFNKEAQVQAKIYLDNFYNTHGSIKSYWVVYRNKSKHDTYYFDKLFANGEIKK